MSPDARPAGHGEREPTADELLAMAYVDGELDEAARREVEARMQSEPALAREVVALQKLELLARHQAPDEPMDHEWRRLHADRVQSTGTVVAVVLSALGAVGLVLWMAYRLLVSDLALLPKAFLCALLGGVLLLFLLVLRARLRTLPYDPYTEVER